MANTNPTLGAGSSTIGGLPLVPENLKDQIPNFAIPVAYNGENYRLLPMDFLDKKFIKGFDRIDNTPDAEKPVSRLQQEALDRKASKEELQQLAQNLQEYRRKDEPLQTSDIQNLSTILANKLDKDGQIAMSQITGLAEALLALAPKDHRHKLADAEDWVEFSQALRESLQNRPTTTEVENMLQAALEGIDTDRLAMAVVWDPSKSRW